MGSFTGHRGPWNWVKKGNNSGWGHEAHGERRTHIFQLQWEETRHDLVLKSVVRRRREGSIQNYERPSRGRCTIRLSDIETAKYFHCIGDTALGFNRKVWISILDTRTLFLIPKWDPKLIRLYTYITQSENKTEQIAKDLMTGQYNVSESNCTLPLPKNKI